MNYFVFPLVADYIVILNFNATNNSYDSSGQGLTLYIQRFTSFVIL